MLYSVKEIINICKLKYISILTQVILRH